MASRELHIVVGFKCSDRPLDSASTGLTGSAPRTPCSPLSEALRRHDVKPTGFPTLPAVRLRAHRRCFSMDECCAKQATPGSDCADALSRSVGTPIPIPQPRGGGNRQVHTASPDLLSCTDVFRQGQGQHSSVQHEVDGVGRGGIDVGAFSTQSSSSEDAPNSSAFIYADIVEDAAELQSATSAPLPLIPEVSEGEDQSSLLFEMELPVPVLFCKGALPRLNIGTRSLAVK